MDTSSAAESLAKTWNAMQVAEWARKQLKFNENDAQIIIDFDLDGDALMGVPSYEVLKTFGFIPGATLRLWTQIELSKVKSGIENLKISSTPKHQPGLTPAKQAHNSLVMKNKQDVIDHSNFYERVEFLLECIEEYQKYKQKSTNKKLDFNNIDKPVKKEANVGKIVMPLQERHEEFTKAMQALQKNIDMIDSQTKQDHTFYTILAGTGAGKSRLGLEISNYISKKLPNTYCARIDFSNGDRINETFEKNCSPSVVLGIRIAARLLAECESIALWEFIKDKYKVPPIQVFSFPVVMEAFYKQRQKNEQNDIANLVLIVDEVNRLLQDKPSAPKEIIQILGAYMCSSSPNTQNEASTHKLALLPIISGTIIGHLQSDIIATSFAYELGSVPLLTTDAVISVFSSVYPKCVSWLNNQTFKRALKLLGRLPRCLEQIVDVCKPYTWNEILDDSTAQFLVEKSYTAISALYQNETMATYITTTVLEKFLHVVLAGQKITEEEIPANQQLRLEREGVTFLQDGYYILPYPLLRGLLPQVDGELVQEHLLPLPSAPFYWQHFEDLEQQLEAVRVKSFIKVFNKVQISVAEFFPGALLSLELGEKLIKLNAKLTIKEHQQYLIKGANIKNKSIVSAGKRTYHFLKSVVKCADGNPLVDIKSMYLTPENGKPIKFVKQMKHGLPANAPGARGKTISWVTVKNWYNQTAKALANWKNNYQIIFVFITNKTITKIEDPNSIQWPANLIVVHKPCLLKYFGPTINHITMLSDDE